MMNILAIDDHPDNLISLKALLGEAIPEANLIPATSGKEGINLAVNLVPDVILLDIVMPGMDGFEVCKQLKTDQITQDIPVVFLTALRDNRESRIKALEVGGEAFLAKPIDEPELIAQVRAMARINEARRSARKEKDRLQQLVNEQTLHLRRQREELQERDRELTKAKEKAEQSDRLKSAFLANMSHEIRTPMNAIVGFAQVLNDPELSSADRDHFIQIIQHRADDLLNIINASLDISRIESGTITPVWQEVKLDDLHREMYQLFRDKLKKAGKTEIALEYDMPRTDDSQLVVTDPYILRQVLANLLDNAVKYTARGKIVFGCQVQEKGLSCFVSDTGIGISRQNQEVIFDHFRQADIPEAQSYGGTGLGLTICRGMLNQLGGEIKVESEPNKGSTFRFTIPLPGDGQGKPKILNATTGKETATPSAWMGKSILVVEDDHYSREYLETVIRGKGARVLSVTCGRELKQLSEKLADFDLILLDIRLPDASGWDLITDIRQAGYDRPVIAQTAYAMVSDQQKSRELGFNDYLPKPVNKQALSSVLDRWLNP